jgi:HPt (histidine-containing phosphotransfer) domain-containing protein
MGHDEQLFSEMAGFLQEDGPRWQREIQQGLATRDAWKTRRAAHTLKGLVANFGAARAVSAASQIEQAANSEDWSSIGDAIPEMDAALHELQAELAPHCERLRPSVEPLN